MRSNQQILQQNALQQNALFHDDDAELFLRNGWPTKGVKPYFQSGPLSEILTIANLRHAESKILITTTPPRHNNTTPRRHSSVVSFSQNRLQREQYRHLNIAKNFLRFVQVFAYTVHLNCAPFYRVACDFKKNDGYHFYNVVRNNLIS